MFNGSFLRVCMKIRIVEKIRFSLLESGRTKPCWNHLLPRGSESRAVRPVGKMNKETTAFIQGPSIVLPVWRCIMFNDSYLRACMKLQIQNRGLSDLLER